MEGGRHVSRFPQTRYTEQVPQPCDFCLEAIPKGEAAGWGSAAWAYLENLETTDGGAWWAAVYGVAQSRTRLK